MKSRGVDLSTRAKTFLKRYSLGMNKRNFIRWTKRSNCCRYGCKRGRKAKKCRDAKKCLLMRNNFKLVHGVGKKTATELMEWSGLLDK